MTFFGGEGGIRDDKEPLIIEEEEFLKMLVGEKPKLKISQSCIAGRQICVLLLRNGEELLLLWAELLRGLLL